MRKNLYFFVVVAILTMASCTDPEVSPDAELKVEMIANAVTDFDGNSYDAVKINNQVWMAENLRSEHYADGTEIPLGYNDEQPIPVTGLFLTYGDAPSIIDNHNFYPSYRRKSSTTEPYRYIPYGWETNVEAFGYLYNWQAVMHGESSSSTSPSGVQGICPNGWHVPSDQEWIRLEIALGMDSAKAEETAFRGRIASKMTANTPYRWGSTSKTNTPALPDTTIENISRLSIYPAGMIDEDQHWNREFVLTHTVPFDTYSLSFYGRTHVTLPDGNVIWPKTGYASFWTATEIGPMRAWYRQFNYDKTGIYRGNYYNNANGYSVRCVKD